MNRRAIIDFLKARYLETLASCIAILGIIITFRYGQQVPLLGIVVSLIALLIGIRHGMTMRAASARANEEYTKANEEYKRAISLAEGYQKWLNEFRGQILSWDELVGELASQISSETESVMLAIDVLTYGAVTVPDAHRKFWAALLSKAASHTPVQIVTFDRNAIAQMIEEQFGTDVAASPTEDVAQQIECHFKHIRDLTEQGEGSVDVLMTGYFPLHISIFKGNRTALLALQETFGDGRVRASGILTHDPTMIEFCRQTFINLQHVARITSTQAEAPAPFMQSGGNVIALHQAN